jgi:LacI family transcriptional regulator
MTKVTIKILAKQLQLSPGSVSKALKDSYEISAQTKKRVYKLAQKLNYVPNLYASSLRKKKSKTIAVVLPEVDDSFFSLAIKGIEAEAQNEGYHVLIYLTHESVAKEKAIFEEFKSGRVDGVIISISRETRTSGHFLDLQKTGIPIVFFDRVFEDIDTAKVITNDYESGYKAAQHLIEKGCKRLTFLSISKYLSIINNRMKGYKKALTDHNMTIGSNTLFCTNDHIKDLQALKELMNKKKHPDGIIASVEGLIIMIYEVCHQLHLSIPGDVKIIGFSNLPSAVVLNPALTTITQPAYEMGKVAASLLLKALEKNTFKLNKENIILSSTLNIRESTM